jgi:hypothetical protein
MLLLLWVGLIGAGGGGIVIAGPGAQAPAIEVWTGSGLVVTPPTTLGD